MDEYLLKQIVNLFFTALGSALFYSTWGRKKLQIYVFSDFLETFHLEPDTLVRVEFIIFIIVGCAISIGIVRPESAAHAFSAGLGWTGLVSRPAKNVMVRK